MIPEQLLLICDEQAFKAANALATDALAHWPNESPPRIHFLQPADLHTLEGEFSRFEAVWIFTNQPKDHQLNNILDTIDEWHTPTLLTRQDESHPLGATFSDGVIIAPPNTPSQSLCLILQSLVCQGRMTNSMKAEMNLVRRHQRGLAGEMDKLDRELRLAARIQKQFMPQILPEIPGINCEVFFQPAGYVSGDIYDVLRIGEHHLGFYIADAVGHGVPAALLTMFIKQAMQTHEILDNTTRILQPHVALSQLNNALVRRQADNVYFVTACYGLIDTRTNELQLASAGHPPPFLFKNNGPLEQLQAPGPLLGIFDDAEFNTATYQLDPGDRLLLYSDGFELAFDDNSDTPNTELYLEEFQNLRNGAPHEALQRLKTKISQQSGSLNQDDDLTALILDIAA